MAADKAFGSFLVDYDKGGVITREGGKENYSGYSSSNNSMIILYFYKRLQSLDI